MCSGRPAYSPAELANLVCGFALLGDCSAEVAGLLDAVAGNIVRRVKVLMDTILPSCLLFKLLRVAVFN